MRAEIEAHPDHPWALHTLGSLLTDQDQTEEGVRSFEVARDRFDAAGEVLGQVYSRLNLGKEYQHAGEFDRASTSYLEAAEIADANHRTDLKYAAQLSLARVLMANETQLGEAWRLVTSIHDQVFPDGEYQTQVLTLHLLSRIAESTNREPERQAVLSRLLQLSVDTGDKYIEVGTRSDLAKLALSRAAAGSAPPEGLVPHIEALLAPISASANPYVAAESHCILALAHRQLEQWEQARSASKTCLEATAALDDSTDLFRAFMVDAYVQAHSDRPAAEQSWQRAAELADTPLFKASMEVERLEFLATAGAYDELAAQLPHARAALQVIRDAQQDPATRSGLSRTRGQQLALAATWLAGIDIPGGAPVDLPLAVELAEVARGGPTDLQLDLSALQASIPPGTALVAYLLPATEVRGWAAILTHDAVRAVPIAGPEPLAPQVDTLIGLVTSRDQAASIASHTLYSRLIAPLGLSPEVHDLVFIPSGALHHLPFGLLQGEDGPLVSTYTTTLIPSLNAWLDRGPPAKGPISSALIVADPNRPQLAPLPHAREEAEQVQDALGAPQEPLLGDRATLQAILSADSPQWVHIAAHLIDDPRFPADTYIPLADRTRLSTHDVRNKEWEGAVVVLSACDSAAGRVLGGEEPLGMTRAFLESGASAVIGSLWPLRDDDAARFFSRFYGYIEQGQDLRSALSHTQRSLYAEGVPAEAWAGVVLAGDGRRAIPPTRSAWLLTGLGMGLSTAALLLGFAYSRRSRMNRSSRSVKNSLRNTITSEVQDSAV